MRPATMTLSISRWLKLYNTVCQHPSNLIWYGSFLNLLLPSINKPILLAQSLSIPIISINTLHILTSGSLHCLSH